MNKDIMIDLETMDNVGSSSIVSVGAVQCNLITGETENEFYRVIDLRGQLDAGCTMSEDTLYWWMKQSDDARFALTTDNKTQPMEFCKSFLNWIGHLEPSAGVLRLWGNGASFDNAIIRHFFRRYGFAFPINFWNDRDMRTIVGFYPYQLQEKWKKENMRVGTHHNALDDAKHQVAYCSHILQELGVEELY